jgi:hypothetical protein
MLFGSCTAEHPAVQLLGEQGKFLQEVNKKIERDIISLY